VTLLRWLLFWVATLMISLAGPAQAAGVETDTALWRARDSGFASWHLAGTRLDRQGALRLAEGATSGEATGPIVYARFAFQEAIPSWNVAAATGGRVTVELRALIRGEWTGWYGLGSWSSAADERRSVRGQADAVAEVAVDTLRLRQRGEAVQMRLRLSAGDDAARPTGETAVGPEPLPRLADPDGPAVYLAAIAYSTAPRPPGVATGNPNWWGRALDVPRCSQMVYPDGGRVWCSPTSTAMIVGYWLADGLACEPRVRAAVGAVYDSSYRGHGNWPFNTAYAGEHGLEAYVARMTSLADAEPWIAAGVPIALSFAFGRGELAGAPIASTSGHLAVLVGFDALGNPILHDPAAPTDGSPVRRVYRRSQLEAAWIGHSAGTVYLIYPPGWPTPPRIATQAS
jgi:hypothetical protein